MSQSLDYELLDFGNGRKLERFGSYIVDRPCPAADHLARRRIATWATKHARFERATAQTGTWRVESPPPTDWRTDHDGLRLLLSLTPAGQVGVFPEQASNWTWLRDQVNSIRGSRAQPRGAVPRVLNLFGYTGASSLAASQAGAEVVHVDSAKSSVQWARRNAELNGIADHPLRWIVEDAWKFVRRELKRGNRYQGIILDPPAYGHGPKNETWDIRRDLTTLWEDCLALLDGPHCFVLLSSHSPPFDRYGLQRLVDETAEFDLANHVELVEMNLHTSDGRTLPSGTTVRWIQSHDL